MAYTTTDLVSAELKGLSITSTTSPSTNQVEQWISEADDEINRRTGKVWSSTVVSSAIFDSDGSSYFRFPEVPVTNISSFEYESNGLGATSEDWNTITEGRTNDFILYVNSGEVQFVNTTPSAGFKNLRVSYTYGPATTPPMITNLSTMMVAKRTVDATINSNAQSGGGSVTVGNISITDPTTFSVSNSKKMGGEIDNTFNNLSNSKVYRPSRWLPLRNA